MNGLADIFEWEIVIIVAKGAFNLDADLFDAEERVGDDDDADDGGPAESLDHGKGECEAIEDKRAAKMDSVSEWHGRFANAFAAAEVIDELLGILIQGGEDEIRDEAFVAGFEEAARHLDGDGEGRVLGGEGFGGFGGGEFVGLGAEAIGGAEGVHGGPGEGGCPAGEAGEESGVVLQVNDGAANEVSGFIDDAAPEFAAFPETFVAGAGAEDEEEAEGETHKGVEERGHGHASYVEVEGDDGGGPNYAERDAAEYFPHERTADVEEVVEPLMGIVLNHGCLGRSSSMISHSPGGGMIADMTFSRRALLFTPLMAATPSVFRGIYPIVQTPFHDDGSLDPATLGKEVTFLLRCGVHGMAWPQLASEFWSLTEEERVRGTEAILAAGKGRGAKLVIGVQADDVAVSLRLAKHAAGLGADALISLPPAGMGLVEFFGKIAAAAPGIPIFLQAVGKLSVEDVIALGKAVPAVRFVKDEAGVTLPRITEFQRKAPELAVFTGGHGRTMIDELLRGAAGSMPAAGPADLYVKAFNLWEKGKQREAALAFTRAAVFVPEFENYGIEGLKYLLVLRGVFPNHVVRGPRNGDVGAVATRAKLDDEGKRALRLIWEAVGR